MPLPKHCIGCGKKFQPTTRSNNYCQECLIQIRHENFKKMLSIRKLKYRRI